MKFLPLPLLLCLLAVAGRAADAPVTLTQDAESFTLGNGFLTARIAKRTGTLTSLQFQGLELIALRGSGANGGYWSSVGRARPGGGNEAFVAVNPATNGGTFAQVTIRQANAPGSTASPVDVDLGYALHRGESWLYAWAIWQHAAGYPPFSVGEARYCLKLNPDVFDFLTVDAARRRLMPSPEDWDRGSPLNVKEARRMTTGVHRGEAEHKYGYAVSSIQNRRVLKIAFKEVWGVMQFLWVFFLLAVLESWSRLLGWYDFAVKGDRHVVWDMAWSQKQNVRDVKARTGEKTEAGQPVRGVNGKSPVDVVRSA